MLLIKSMKKIPVHSVLSLEMQMAVWIGLIA